MSAIQIDAMIAGVLVSAVPEEWRVDMPKHMLSVSAAQTVVGHGYAKTASLLRDLADIIENTGMKMEFPNGN